MQGTVGILSLCNVKPAFSLLGGRQYMGGLWEVPHAILSGGEKSFSDVEDVEVGLCVSVEARRKSIIHSRFTFTTKSYENKRTANLL